MADIIFPGEAPEGDVGITRLPNNVDFSMWQGDVQLFYLRFTDNAEPPNPIDLTGYTAEAVIRPSPGTGTEYAFECTIQGVDNNEVKVYMPSSVTSTLTPGDYAWNFQLVDVVGDARTYLAGDVKVFAQVD